MKRPLFALSVAALAAASFAQSVPKVLIVQRMAPVVEGADFNVVARNHFATEFDADGRLQPIVYSTTDPVFRAAIDKGTIQNPPENPKNDEAFEIARRLECDFVLIVSSLKHGEGVLANAQLFRGRREVWKQESRLQVTANNQFAHDDAARSLARTWVLQMGQGPLKEFAQRRMTPTPDPDPGVKPIIPDVPIRPKPAVDNATLREDVRKLRQLGSHDSALQMLWDAVDAEPMDVERRAMLIELLLDRNDTASAGEEARRAAGLFPENETFWVLSARCEMAKGNLPQAIRDLNEAVTRHPDSPITRAALGDVQLVAGRYSFAIEHFDVALKAGPTPLLHLKRGCARLMLGQAAPAAADLKIAEEGLSGLSPEARRELTLSAYLMLSGSADRLGAELRDLITAARRSPRDAAVRERRNEAQKQIEALVSVGNALERFTNNPQSQQRLLLAVRLLRQCVSEIGAHLASPNEDALSDATITLGEAFRAIEQAKQVRATEQP